MELFDSSSINFSCCALKNGKFSSAKNYESGSIVLLILLSGAFCFLLHTLSRKCYVVRYFMLSFLFLFFWSVCMCICVRQTFCWRFRQCSSNFFFSVLFLARQKKNNCLFPLRFLFLLLFFFNVCLISLVAFLVLCGPGLLQIFY